MHVLVTRYEIEISEVYSAGKDLCAIKQNEREMSDLAIFKEVFGLFYVK